MRGICISAHVHGAIIIFLLFNVCQSGEPKAGIKDPLVDSEGIVLRCYITAPSSEIIFNCTFLNTKAFQGMI